MTIEWLVGTYGCAAVVVGTFLEGETILVLAGFLAHQGYLKLGCVMLSAFAGSLAGDQLFFLLGRRYGRAFLDRRPAWRDRICRVNGLVRRYQSLLIVSFRFLYGLRTATPFALGMSREVPVWRFVTLNAVGAALWAMVIGAGGYAFGAALKLLLVRVERYELAAIVGIAAVGVLGWAIHLLRHHSRHQGRNPRR